MVANAAQVAACFDVYVVSSLYEGLGRSLTEALASGRPVVATAVNGVIDMVEPGSTGLLVPAADPGALANAVAWALEHLAEARRMGEAARRRAFAIFGPATMCALIEETYARLLGLPPSAASQRAPNELVPAAELGLAASNGGRR